MADPVLVLHGVANRDKAAFERQVQDLNRRVDKATQSWRFVPIFWGDLGGAVERLADAIPRPRALEVRGESLAPSSTLVATLLRGTGGEAALTRSGGEGWRIVADAVSETASGAPLVLVREDEDAEVVRNAIADAWAETRALQNIEDPELLAEIGRAIAEGLSETSSQQPAIVRGLPEDLKAKVKGLVRGIDRAVGAVVGSLAGGLNEYLRTSFGPNIGRFLGDVFVYQRRHADIQRRLWEVLDREAPGWGTEERPIPVIAHSLGGVISFDGLGHRRLWIRRFITFGSQSAFFHVIDPRGPLGAYKPGTPVGLPNAIGAWTNLWEPLDPLAFLAGRVFRLSAGKPPVDIEVPHRASSGLWTHSVYWTDEALVDAIRTALS